MSQLTYCRSSAVAYLLVPYGVHTRGHLDRSGGGGLCGLPVYRYILIMYRGYLVLQLELGTGRRTVSTYYSYR
jgi:hypothetical protein